MTATKPKMVAGVLCRDGRDFVAGGPIAFLPHARRRHVRLARAFGCWVLSAKGCRDPVGLWSGWTPANWKKNYNLKPPEPGTCFEAELVL